MSIGDLQPTDRVVDVRTPAEFAEDHFPNAVNVPLLNDSERVQVGTLFRVEGAQAATDWALLQLRSRLHSFLAQLETHLGAGVRLVICCALGGDRSRHVVQFLDALGIASAQLMDGYRGYRSQVRQSMKELNFPNLFLLDGLTGTGKTRLLREVARHRPQSVLDLEGYAEHRSSMLGDIGLQPTSQKRFESRLYRFTQELNEVPDWFLIEAESRKVGNREIPLSLWQQMQNAPRIQLTATMEIRCRILELDYQTADGWGPLIERLRALGPHSDYSEEEIEDLCQRLSKGEVESVAEDLLVRHYDPRYRHQMEKFAPLKRFEIVEPESAAVSVIDFLDAVVSGQDS